MLEFAHPAALLLLPLAALGWLPRRRPAARYASLALVAGLPLGRAGEATAGRQALRSLAAVTLALAVAGPRLPDHATRVPVQGITMVLVLDVSGSMGEADYGGPLEAPVTRLTAAQAAFRRFVQGGDGFPGRPQDSLGLVAFAAVPQTVCPPTLNHSVLLTLADAQTPATGPDAGTSLGDAVAEALARLEAAPPGRKVVVVLSDGEHNASGAGPSTPLTPKQAGAVAAGLGVTVTTIDCGPDHPSSAESALQRVEGKKALEDLAERTGGRYLAAGDPAALEAALKRLDELERGPADPFRYRRYREFTPALALLATLLVAAGAALEATRWRVAPV